MLNLSPAESRYLTTIQEQLNGDKILFGSYFNLNFEEVFLTANKKIDVKKKNYIHWMLTSMENTLDNYMKEVAPMQYVIEGKYLIRHANSVNLTILILKRKIAYYQHGQVITYTVV